VDNVTAVTAGVAAGEQPDADQEVAAGLAGNDAGAAQEVVETIAKIGGRAVALRGDVTREDDVVGMFVSAENAREDGRVRYETARAALQTITGTM